MWHPSRDFVVIGENIHATRVLLQKSERIATNEQGEEGIVFIDEDGATRHLRIPEEEKHSQPYQEGRIKHVRLAVQIAMAGVEPDCSTALSYLRMLTQRQVRAGAHFLDVNVDEISNKLADQLEAMRWLVRTLAPRADVPLSIDSSNLEIIAAGVTEAAEAAGSRVGPPMLNSASLERIEALELAARLQGAVVVTAAGESGMPTNTEERVVNASRMIEASLAAGIELDRIFVDPLVFPIAVDSEYGRHCLDAIAEIRRRFGDEVHITGGMSNVSFGLPNRRLLNDAFLALAIESGADSGIVDPTVVSMQRALAVDRTSRPFQLALDVLTGADENCRSYMKAYRAGELTPAAS
jgi:5-methyltetrahydrofolate--homocysteine methyltransferase